MAVNICSMIKIQIDFAVEVYCKITFIFLQILSQSGTPRMAPKIAHKAKESLTKYASSDKATSQ